MRLALCAAGRYGHLHSNRRASLHRCHRRIPAPKVGLKIRIRGENPRKQAGCGCRCARKCEHDRSLGVWWKKWEIASLPNAASTIGESTEEDSKIYSIVGGGGGQRCLVSIAFELCADHQSGHAHLSLPSRSATTMCFAIIALVVLSAVGSSGARVNILKALLGHEIIMSAQRLSTCWNQSFKSIHYFGWPAENTMKPESFASEFACQGRLQTLKSEYQKHALCDSASVTLTPGHRA